MVDQDKKMKALTGAADKAATELSYINTNINTLYSNNTNMIYTMQLAKAKKSRDDLSEELKRVQEAADSAPWTSRPRTPG